MNTEFASANPSTQAWAETYRKAINCHQSNLYEQAADLFGQLIGSGGLQGHLARFYHGQACRKAAEGHMATERFDRAEKYLRQAIESNPGSPTILGFLADCYVKQGRYANAAHEFSQLARAHDAPEPIKLKAALSLYVAGRTDRAIEILDELVADHPTSFDINLHLGTFLAAEGHTTRAIRHLTHACKLRPELPTCHWKLALAHGAAGHIPEAVDHLQRAHTLDPANNWVLMHLTVAVRQAKHYGMDVHVDLVKADPWQSDFNEQTIDQLAELIADEPEFVAAFLDLPQSELDEQIFSGLLRIIMRAIERHGEFADLHYHCSRVYQRLGQTEHAIAESQRALQIHPRFVSALVGLAKLYAQTDRRQQAIDRLHAAIGNGANYADVHYMLAELYREQGYADRARVHYRRALSINNEFSAAKQALADLAA